MFMHYVINWVLEKSFDLPLLQFVDDIQINLQTELDFRIETENSIIGKNHFKQLSMFCHIENEISCMCLRSTRSIPGKGLWFHSGLMALRSLMSKR